MDNLEKLKYKDLRNLAKSLGLKAKGKADKLIREIRNHNEGNGTSTERKRNVSASSTVSTSSEDTEIVFCLNPVLGAADVEEVPGQSVDDDDEIVFVAIPAEEEHVNYDEGNQSADLENYEDQLSEKNEHNETVEFEEHQETISELVDEEVEEQLNTTFEIETDKDDQGDNAMEQDKEEDKDKDEEEEERHMKEEKADDADNVQDLFEVMRPEMTDEEMKAELMAAIDKKVKNKKVIIMSPNAPSDFVSRIPTFSTTLQKSQANEKKATLKGKDWQKIHEKLFSKQDSLDVYLAKKTKRMQRLKTPIKSAKRIAAESQKTVEKLMKHKETKSATKSSAQNPSLQSFIPKIVSTKSMSLQFTTTASTVSSVTKSTHRPAASTNQSQTNKIIKSAKKSLRKSLSDSAKKIKHSPHKMSPAKSLLVKKPFTPFNSASTSLAQTPDSLKKAKFDLKASLAKPMTWKRHTGKLRPIAIGEVEPQYFKKGLIASIQTNRENRRAITTKSRINKRDNLLNSRRKIK